MSFLFNKLLEFGNCTYNIKTRKLTRTGVHIPLQPKATAILEHVIINRERAISREELTKTFWPGVNVTPNAVDYQIKLIRKALGSSDSGDSYIKSTYGTGWQFVAEVREVEVIEPTKLPVQPPQVSPKPPLPPKPAKKKSIGYWLAGAAASLAAITAFHARPSNANVTQFVQITNDGQPKFGPILTDGRRLFFSEGAGAFARAVTVLVTGGKPVALPMPSGLRLLDISPDGQNLLFTRKQALGIRARGFKRQISSFCCERSGGSAAATPAGWAGSGCPHLVAG